MSKPDDATVLASMDRAAREIAGYPPAPDRYAPLADIGLRVEKCERLPNREWKCWVSADDLLALIEQAPRVYGIADDPATPRLPSLEWTMDRAGIDTHTALLLAIKPLAVADTAEGLLREALDKYGDLTRDDWVGRARTLLARAKGE